MQELPTLMQLRRATPITSSVLAERAGVPLRVEYLMEIGGAVRKEDALKVLRAFSVLSGQTYTLEQVAINLAEQGDIEDE